MNVPVTIMVCGPKNCDHVWDGPEVPILADDGVTEIGSTATCSKCGMDALTHSLWTAN